VNSETSSVVELRTEKESSQIVCQPRPIRFCGRLRFLFITSCSVIVVLLSAIELFPKMNKNSLPESLLIQYYVPRSKGAAVVGCRLL
jgi:hypothetical protein